LKECKDAIHKAEKIAEFVWHMDKSINYLRQADDVLGFLSAGMSEISEHEPEVWETVQRSSLSFLVMRSEHNCACKSSLISSPFGACYGPGKPPGTPKKRLMNL
jgi:hypothetical protein